MSEQKYYKAVSVDDELPELSGTYFVIRSDVIAAMYVSDFDNTVNKFIAHDVTHWLKPIEPPEPLTDGELIEKCKEVLLRHCVYLKATNQNVSGKWLNENAIHALTPLLKQAGYQSAQSQPKPDLETVIRFTLDYISDVYQPIGKEKLIKDIEAGYKAAKKNNVWCYEQVCLAEMLNLPKMLLANLLIARVMCRFYSRI